ncbi:methyl-accepting chemotaxis protein [Gellertiella hungarica]|uniref:Methyl-accepting chemotaxis protein n=1 Tax=Gellertiella hungarica TaxID=1572859 RepID=A0A7W6NLU1_9HYPH|nr:methyl-accepting chemotaxis protein [Gellertiella hungarica]MBB4065800.1 methyl-accepting chemotaxis protein [Gellertiella hungarica]
MLVDKILSRFKIKTKVLIFVLPFVISISAVGLTGLYASGLLEGRMTLSNNVLQSLSGFKELTSSMNDFVHDTNEESFSLVLGYLHSQQSALMDTKKGAGTTADGIDKLDEALDGTAAVPPLVETLWALHGEAEEKLAELRKAQQSLVGISLMVATQATAVEQRMQLDESAAKDMLRQADFLSRSRDLMTSIPRNFFTATDPAAKVKAFADVILKLKRIKGPLAQAMPDGGKDVLAGIEDLIAKTEPLIGAEPNADTISQLQAQFPLVNSLASQFFTTASRRTQEATKLFGSLDAKIVAANSALTDVRILQKDIAALQLAEAEFHNDMTEKSLGRLQAELKSVTSDLAAVEISSKGIDELKDVTAEVPPVVASIEASARALLDNRTQREETYGHATATIDKVWRNLTSFAEMQKVAAGTEKERANGVSMLATVLGIVLSISGGIALVLTLQRPIGQITGVMRRIADGYLDTSISGVSRADEIGEMARALGIFKENALSKLRMEEETAHARDRAEEERRRHDAEKQAFDQQLEYAVSQLASGLGRLAQGDLSVQLDTAFSGRLDQLRVDFNASVERLHDTLMDIQSNAMAIQSKGSDLMRSAAELSQRTESQAASLEEAAASVDEITVTVRSTAERAREANRAVSQTKSTADNSASVVENAISAMGRIEQASKQIEQIIEVIDEIAFQTNLLALNAGIEAARAGEAGKGFAVVAQEVRELAQRSAEAAREIKDLITKSSEEVTGGSKLVLETGAVLAEISRQIAAVSQHVETISTAAQDQSAALQEINGSVNNMDQMTQQNAAVASHTTEASRDLSSEADQLMALVNRFRLAQSAGRSQAYAA